jgi:hypothetical protein
MLLHRLTKPNKLLDSDNPVRTCSSFNIKNKWSTPIPTRPEVCESPVVEKAA